MKILVTGAAGFIGSSLCKALLDSDHEVVGIDNLNDYYSVDLKKIRLNSLLQYSGFNFHLVDISDHSTLSSIYINNEFSTVYHLAAQAGVRLPNNQLDKYINSNISGFTNILNLTVDSKIENFLYASSSSVYGNSDDGKLSESSESMHPNSYYGGTKLFNELIAPIMTRNSITKTRGLRFFTVYGPMGRPDMAYFRIINSLFNGEDFKLFGDGTVSRDFTYIDDVVTSIIKLENQLRQDTKKISDVVNVGGGQPHSMKELIDYAQQITGHKLRIQYTESNENDVKRTEADTQLIETLTGFKPTISLEEGVRRVINWSNQQEIREKLNDWVNSSS